MAPGKKRERPAAGTPAAEPGPKGGAGRTRKTRKTFWQSTRERLDSVLVALVLASIFRTFIMEAFEIPTGSMAPTLYGRHVDVVCPACHYHYSVGADRQMEADGSAGWPPQVCCPLCGSIADLPLAMRVEGGDRILVDKGAYTLADPKRWDVGVFVNPHTYAENYIKRVVGLPGDRLLIRNGDIYVNGEIARKPDRIQEVLWMPVFNSNFPPNNSWTRPWPDRMDLDLLTSHCTTEADGVQTWVPPWRQEDDRGTWDLAGRVFSFTPDPADTRTAFIRFTWPIYDTYGYGQREQRRQPADEKKVVGDIRLRADLTLTGPGVVRCTIIDGATQIDYVLSGEAGTPSSIRLNGELQTRSAAEAPLLTPGRTHHIAFVNVDDRAWVEVDGHRPLGRVPFDATRPPPSQEEEAPKALFLGAARSPTTFANVLIDRDIYYTKTMYPSEAYAVASEYTLREGEYFVLGDNSPGSLDSRRWWQSRETWRSNPEPSPVVNREHFIGKAFVLYWPHYRKLWRIKIIH